VPSWRRWGALRFYEGWANDQGLWHLIEHDVHHGGEISQILGSHGIPALVL
jgi:uncharacterized damage-inducible protein DinB